VSSTAPLPESNAPTATPRAPYVSPTLEPLGSWSALTMQLTGGGGFIQNPIISRIVGKSH
jgi:hypothetical protein